MILFNITTSATWGGAPVGITRVERELGLRARHHLGDEVVYGIYSKPARAFHRVSYDSADAILQGRLKVDLEGPHCRPPVRHRSPIRQLARLLLLLNGPLFRFVQRGRGMRYSPDQVREFRREAWHALRRPVKSTHATPLWNVSEGRIPLSENVAVVSVGLDWDGLDLLTLTHLKRQDQFRYFSMIHDLIPLRYPHFVPPGYDTLIMQYIGDLSWLADGFLCNSERSRQDLYDYFSVQGRPPPPAAVFSLGCDPGDRSARSSEIVLADQLAGLSYVLYVSTIEPRKNHRTLYEAWDYGMRHGLFDSDKHRLVFAGRVGWNIGDLLAEIRNNPVTKDTILIVNDLDDGQLQQLYRQAAFGVFPSHVEGFGLPVGECLAAGKTCIVSEGLPLPEQQRELTAQLEAKDTMAWARLISSFLHHPEKVSDMERRIRAEFVPFTWDSSADAFFSGLRELEASSRSA